MTSVAVLAAHGELRALATRDLRTGEVVLTLEGVLVSAPTRFTVQVGPANHLEIPDGVTWREQLERYSWRFLNHSCSPNTRIAGPGGRNLVALVDIAEGTELDFDYESNEYELAEPFTCRCPRCAGRPIRGFRFLSQAERERRRATLSDHLLPHLDSPSR